MASDSDISGSYVLSAVQGQDGNDAHPESFLSSAEVPDLLLVEEADATSYDKAKLSAKKGASGPTSSHITFRSSIKSSGYGSAAPRKPSWATSKPKKGPAASSMLSSGSEPLQYPDDAPLPSGELSTGVWSIYSGLATARPGSSSRPSSSGSLSARSAPAATSAAAATALPLEGAIRSLLLSHDGGELAVSTQAGSIACMRLVCKTSGKAAAAAAGGTSGTVVRAAPSPGSSGTTGPLSKLWAKKLSITPASFTSSSLAGGAFNGRAPPSASASASSVLTGSAAAAAAALLERPVCTSLSWSASAVEALRTPLSTAGLPAGPGGRASKSSSSSASSRSLADVVASASDGGSSYDESDAASPAAATAAASAAAMTPRLLLGCGGSSKEACVWLSYGNKNDPVLAIRGQEGGDMRNEWKIQQTAASATAASAASASSSASPSLFPSSVTSGLFFDLDRFILLACGNSVHAYTYRLDTEALAIAQQGGGASSKGEEDLLRLKRAQQPRSTYKRVAWWQAASATSSVTSMAAHNSFRSPLLTVACSDRSLRVFDLAVDACPALVLTLEEAHDRPIHTLALPQASPFAASSSAVVNAALTASTEGGGTVKLWDLRAARAAVTMTGGHVNRVHSTGVSMSADGLYVATGSEDRAACVYDVRMPSGSSPAVAKYKGATDAVTAVAFHPQTPALFAGSLDGCVRLFGPP